MYRTTKCNQCVVKHTHIQVRVWPETRRASKAIELVTLQRVAAGDEGRHQLRQQRVLVLVLSHKRLVVRLVVELVAVLRDVIGAVRGGDERCGQIARELVLLGAQDLQRVAEALLLNRVEVRLVYDACRNI